MTKRQAKKLTLEAWKYLKDNPRARIKAEMPRRIYKKIVMLKNKCPLCALYLKSDTHASRNCGECPLRIARQCCLTTKGGVNERSCFAQWEFARDDNEARKIAATKLYDIVKAWKV